MSEWDDESVVGFLNAYEKHPSLWNPYCEDFYNCAEKHEALQSIIRDLGTPGFTVNDYFNQMKIIRTKYKQEQLLTIKALQSKKEYKSPYPWYEIVARMLKKVISDEEKAIKKAHEHCAPREVLCPGFINRYATEAHEKFALKDDLEHSKSSVILEKSSNDKGTQSIEEIESKKIASTQKQDILSHSDPVDEQIIELNPKSRDKLGVSSIEACTKIKILFPKLRKNLIKYGISSNKVSEANQEANEISQDRLAVEKRNNGTQMSPEKKMQETGVNTKNYDDKGVQSRISKTSEINEPIAKRCVMLQTVNQIEKRAVCCCTSLAKIREIGTDSMPPPPCEIQNVPCSNKIQEGPGADFVLLTPGGKYVSLIRGESDQVTRRCVDVDLNPCEANCSCTVQNCCVPANCMIDLPEIVNLIKECTIAILKSNCTMNDCSRSPVKPTVSQTICTKLKSTEVQTTCTKTNKFTETEDTCPRPILRGSETSGGSSGYRKIDIKVGEDISGIITESAAEKIDKVTHSDKVVSALSNTHDAGTNSSLLTIHVQDVGVQSFSRVPNSVSTDVQTESARRMISTGTQKRDPIMLRVIKYKGDKTEKTEKSTTAVPEIDLMLDRSYRERNEFCNRPTCRPYSRDRNYSSRISNEKDSDSEKTNRNFSLDCSKDCKEKQIFLDPDWSDVITNTNTLYSTYISKRPFHRQIRKCFRRINTEKL